MRQLTVLHDVLEYLYSASEYAARCKMDEWQFSVDLSELEKLGATRNDIRWLIGSNLIFHGQELTNDEQEQRTHKIVHHTNLGACSRFVIAKAAIPLLDKVKNQLTCGNGSCAAPGADWAEVNLPCWDAVRQELRVGSQVIKRFRLPARNQELVLSAFEEESWPYRVDDPLPQHPSIDPKTRLHDTIHSLNRNQQHRLIHFLGDGSGQGICWKFLSDSL